MAKSALDAPRGNIFLVDPEQLTIVTDEKDPLFDPRCKLPIDENLIKNIMIHGVRQVINVQKRGDQIVVVDGRQRVRHAVEANKRLKAEGAEPVRVKAFLEKGTDADLFGLTVLLNEHRRDDDVVGKAEKAQKLLNLGKTPGEVAILFGVTTQTISHWQSLLEAAPVVQRAVASGEVSASAAVALSKLPREEQADKLAELKAAAPTTGKRAGKVSARAAKAAAGAGKGSDRPTMAEIKLVREWMESCNDSFDDHAVLDWVLGEVSTKSLFEFTIAQIRKQVEDERAEAAEQEPEEGKGKSAKGKG